VFQLNKRQEEPEVAEQEEPEVAEQEEPEVAEQERQYLQRHLLRQRVARRLHRSANAYQSLQRHLLPQLQQMCQLPLQFQVKKQLQQHLQLKKRLQQHLQLKKQLQMRPLAAVEIRPLRTTAMAAATAMAMAAAMAAKKGDESMKKSSSTYDSDYHHSSGLLCKSAFKSHDIVSAALFCLCSSYFTMDSSYFPI
jgi:hypothetical protein